MRPRAMPALEALLVLGVTLPLAVGLRFPTIWFLAPFAVISLARRPYHDYGLTLRNCGTLRFHLAVTLVILGGYCAAHYAYGRWFLGLSFEPTIPPDFPRLVFDQVVIVGLSEEFFFRGYLQTQLNRFFGRPYRFIGARWGVGLIVAAVLFGLCHLVYGDLSRLRVIIFGLFAGWLRERTDSIAVPATYHGASNILFEIMQRSLR